MNEKKARTLVEKAWEYKGKVGIGYHLRAFEASSKQELLEQLLKHEPEKCPLFDKCGSLFKGIRPHHEWCFDYEYAKQRCGLL